MNELKDYYMLKSLFHIRIDMRIYVGLYEIDTTIPKKAALLRVGNNCA